MTRAPASRGVSGTSYHAFTRNCCTFCDDLCAGLGVGQIPPWINNLANAIAPVANAGAAVTEAGAMLSDDIKRRGKAADEVRSSESSRRVCAPLTLVGLSSLAQAVNMLCYDDAEQKDSAEGASIVYKM